MKQDCTVSPSTANVANASSTPDKHELPKGTLGSEPDTMTGSVVEEYAQVKCHNNTKLVESQRLTPVQPHHNTIHAASTCQVAERYQPASWCYLFIHHNKVMACEELLKKDGLTYFVHKTIKYVPRHRKKGGILEVEKPTVSGLVFIQGQPTDIQKYLDEKLPSHRLCKNCSTGRVAIIPCSQMEPFMRVAETQPDRLRFLLRPFVYYAKNRTLLRITTGEYAGLEGYVIRIARDRKLVMNVGGIAVALSGIHAERFEEVHKNEADKTERATYYKRNLHERNAFIDRYFHRVKSAQEVTAQVENINILRLQTLADVADRRLDLKDAYETFYFMIEEIGYYYAPFINYFKNEMKPIFEAGRTIMNDIEQAMLQFSRSNAELFQRCEAEYEALQNSYGYLFE